MIHLPPATNLAARSSVSPAPHTCPRRDAIHRRPAGLLIAAALLIVAGGCSSVPTDLGRADVDAMLAARGHVRAPADGAERAAWLGEQLDRPLSAPRAVQIALVNNPELQATYATLGFGAADVYEAGRLSNLTLDAARLDPNVAGERNLVTLGIAASFAELITLPARARLSEAAFAALRQSVAHEALVTAANAEKAYYESVGAEQVATLRRKIADAAAISAALAQRFRDAGNLDRRGLAFERAAASEARLAALDAGARAFAARAALAQVLGLPVGGDWQVPSRLRLPPDHDGEPAALIADALEARLDLAAARTEAALQADRRGITGWTRWLGDLDVGYEWERETDGTRLRGPTLGLEIPLFNQHRDQILRADAQWQMALSDVRRLTFTVENEVRAAHAAVTTARERVREYRDVLIPQRKEIVARAQEQVNFMLIGVFELLSLKRDEYDAIQGYLEALRDYWLARADLRLATGGALPQWGDEAGDHVDVDDFVRPPGAAMDHGGHDHHDHHGAQAPADPREERPDDTGHHRHHRHPNGESP